MCVERYACPSPKRYPRLKALITYAFFGLATDKIANDTYMESQSAPVESPTARFRRGAALYSLAFH